MKLVAYTGKVSKYEIFLHKMQCFSSSKQRLSIMAILLKLHTYIIAHYNPSVRIIDLISHTTYVMCVNFKQQRCDLQIKVNSERQIFEKLFIAIFIYSHSFYQKSVKKYLLYFVFNFWPRARILALRVISQHTTYQAKATSKLHMLKRAQFIQSVLPNHRG